MVSDQLILHVYAGNHNSSFAFYEDDGTTFNYQKGEFLKREFELWGNERKIILQESEGTFESPHKMIKLVLHGVFHEIHDIRINGNNISVSREINQFFAALEKFDPIYDPEPAPYEDVYAVEFNYSSKKVIIDF
jgi:alpha-glucosidase